MSGGRQKAIENERERERIHEHTFTPSLPLRSFGSQQSLGAFLKTHRILCPTGGLDLMTSTQTHRRLFLDGFVSFKAPIWGYSHLLKEALQKQLSDPVISLPNAFFLCGFVHKCSFVLHREFARWKVRNTAIERRDLIRNPVPLMPEFQRSVRLLGRRPTTQQFIDTIIKKYGTHILISATLGGRRDFTFTFKSVAINLPAFPTETIRHQEMKISNKISNKICDLFLRTKLLNDTILSQFNSRIDV